MKEGINCDEERYIIYSKEENKQIAYKIFGKDKSFQYKVLRNLYYYISNFAEKYVDLSENSVLAAKNAYPASVLNFTKILEKDKHSTYVTIMSPFIPYDVRKEGKNWVFKKHYPFGKKVAKISKNSLKSFELRRVSKKCDARMLSSSALSPQYFKKDLEFLLNLFGLSINSIGYELVNDKREVYNMLYVPTKGINRSVEKESKYIDVSYYEYILDYHPDYKNPSKKTVKVGVTERTGARRERDGRTYIGPRKITHEIIFRIKGGKEFEKNKRRKEEFIKKLYEKHGEHKYGELYDIHDFHRKYIHGLLNLAGDEVIVPGVSNEG